MNFIAVLPTELISTILAQWLTVTDIALLDSAFCLLAARDEFVSLLRSSGGVYHVSDDIYNESESAIERWIIKKGLKVSNILINEYTDQNIFTEFMDHTGDKLTTLKILALEESDLESYIRDDCMKRSGCCPLLRSVTLEVEEMNDATAIAVVQLAPLGNIQKLRCSASITDTTINRIAKHCPNLEVLSFYRHDTDCDIIAQITQHCPLIRHLDINSALDLDDELFAPVLKMLKLETLILDNNEFTDATVDLIIAHQRDTLKTLFVANCDDITPEGLIRIAQNCPHLHTLSVGGTQDDELFTKRFFNAFAHLETLLLSSDEVDYACMKLVAKHCTKLKRFGVLASCGVEKGLLVVVESCKNLREIHTNELDKKYVEKYKKINPALVIKMVKDDLHEFDIMLMEHVF